MHSFVSWKGPIQSARRRAIVASMALSMSLFGCSDSTDSNQKQGAVSPDGQFVLSVPVERGVYPRVSVWKVTVTDRSGRPLYKDEQSTMPGTLAIYWGWDEQGRVWVYNSDDGTKWVWERSPSGWKKRQPGRHETIPRYVLPAYAR